MSSRKLGFLNQQLELGLDWGEGIAFGDRLNVVVLWSVDGDFNLIDLYLSLPAGAAMKPQSYTAYWTEKVELAAQVAMPETPPLEQHEADLVPLEWLQTDHSEDEAEAE